MYISDDSRTSFELVPTPISLVAARAWHFKHHVTYCVAPVVTNRTQGPVSGCKPRRTCLFGV